mmetsp:Transcript_15418/g.27894  ORF Transcript_15418/g.27894 Transcript_15418/m.27894 type:complete len:205 (-) Transcript_15418:626-1240(-)
MREGGEGDATSDDESRYSAGGFGGIARILDGCQGESSQCHVFQRDRSNHVQGHGQSHGSGTNRRRRRAKIHRGRRSQTNRRLPRSPRRSRRSQPLRNNRPRRHQEPAAGTPPHHRGRSTPGAPSGTERSPAALGPHGKSRLRQDLRRAVDASPPVQNRLRARRLLRRSAEERFGRCPVGGKDDRKDAEGVGTRQGRGAVRRRDL